jgi:hypothetical protein
VPPNRPPDLLVEGGGGQKGALRLAAGAGCGLP